MSRARVKLSACVLAVGALAAGCGGGDEEAATPPPAPYDVAAGVGSPAAELRSRLSSLLQEHALLTGITTNALISSEDPTAPGAVLDQNAVELGALVTDLYGEPAGTQFLDAWRRRSALMLEFAAASGLGEKPRIDKAKADLGAVEKEIAGVLNAANKQLTVEALGEALDAFSRSLQAAVTAQAKRDATAVVKLKEASDETAAAAIVLAAGIVKFKPDDFPGSLDGIGSAMRAELTSKLQEHTYLVGVATGAMLAGGDMEPPADALEENSLELARAFGTVYGDDVQRQFLDLWRDHIGFVVDFAEAARAQDAAGMDKARRDLDGYRDAFATFLSTANPSFAKDDVVDALSVHVDSLLAVVSAQAAKDPGQVARLHEAAGHMPETALFLATGIARQFPTKFG